MSLLKVYFFLILLGISFQASASPQDIGEQLVEKSNISSSIHFEERDKLEEKMEQLKIFDTLDEVLTIVAKEEKEDFAKFEKEARNIFENTNSFTDSFRDQFSPLDHYIILKKFLSDSHTAPKEQEKNSVIYRYYLIYNSMFPSSYESEDIKEILEQEDLLSDAVGKLKIVEEDDLKDICKNLTEIYETDYVESFYENSHNKSFPRDWLLLANSLNDIIKEKRYTLTTFISYLPKTFSVEPQVALEAFIKSFYEIDALEDFETLRPDLEELPSNSNQLDYLLEIIKKKKPPIENQKEDDYPAFRRYLLEWREEKGVKQYEIARLLGVAPSTVSRFLKGKILKSPILLENYRKKVGFPRFEIGKGSSCVKDRT